MTFDRFCRDCKYLLGIRHYLNPEEVNLKWACLHPNNLLSSEVDVVTGQPVNQLRWERIRDCRTVGCKLSGEWFEAYEKPIIQPGIASSRSKSTISADDL